MNVVILAGGQGTRLWPMSRKNKPKQFYNILSEKPMIVDVFERLKKEFDSEQIFVSTTARFADEIKSLLPELGDERCIVEPCKKDSGPAMAYVAHILAQQGRGGEPMVFVPTDHFIADDEKFLRGLRIGEKLIQETGKMLDISVTPQFPSTVLGYTQIGDKYQNIDGVDVFHFMGHKEKPDQETAQQYIESGKYLWHANYYMWTPDKLLAAYKSHAPEIVDLLEKMRQVEAEEEKNNLFEQMPVVSIDYAVTEKMDPNDVLIIRGDFGWSDIGAWDVLYDRLNIKDTESTNVREGKVVDIDTHNCLLYSKGGKMIATIGVNDLVVVDTEDALLICPQGRSQEVKNIVKKLKEDGLEEYL